MLTDGLVMGSNEKIEDALYSAAQVMLEQTFNSDMLYINDVLDNKTVNVLMLANIAANENLTAADKQELQKAFSHVLNEKEFNAILRADKTTLNEIVEAAKELNTLAEEDELNTRITLENDDELEDAAYVASRIKELKKYIEDEIQSIFRTADKQVDKTKQIEKTKTKEMTIDF